MRILLMMATMLLVFNLSFGQELNTNAIKIKTNFPAEYSNTIRANAVNEWGNDHNMVVFQINLQSDELMALLSSYKSAYSNILYAAVVNWSTEGYESANKKVWQSIDSATLANFLKLNVNWQMVKFEYDLQVKASNAY